MSHGLFIFSVIEMPCGSYFDYLPVHDAHMHKYTSAHCVKIAVYLCFLIIYCNILLIYVFSR